MAEIEEQPITESIEALSSKYCRHVITILQDHEENFPTIKESMKPVLGEIPEVDQKNIVKGALTKLEEAGLIRSFEKNGNFGDPKDRWYELTPLARRLVDGILRAYNPPKSKTAENKFS